MKNLWLNRINVLAVASVLAFGGIVSAQNGVPPTPPSSTGTQTTGASRTDGQIESDVVQALDAVDALKNDLITAATIQGSVTLSGTVATDSNRQLAESIVRKVNGVGQVRNNLKIGDPAKDANAVSQDDDPAARAIQDQADSGAPPQQPTWGNQQPDPNRQQPGTPQENGQYGQQPQTGKQQPLAGQQRPPYNQQRQPQYGDPRYGNNAPPPPPGYGPGYPPPPYRQPYSPQRPGYAIPRDPLTIGPGTALEVRTNGYIDTRHAQDGTPVDFTLIRDVLVNGYLAIPRGATVRGVVTETRRAGQLTGSPELALRLTTLEMDGRAYPLDSDEFRVRGPSKTGHTVGNAIGGAILGAMIGGAVGGGGGAAVGAVAGGGAGTAASAASNPNVWIPAEAQAVFHLRNSLTVDPVSRDEAMRLAQGLYPGGPTLYRRNHGPRFYAQGAPYGYPPVYYRPYAVYGGYYDWR